MCGRLSFCYREAGSAGERSSTGRTGFTVVETPAYSPASFFEPVLANQEALSIKYFRLLSLESGPHLNNNSVNRDIALRALLVT